MAPGDDALLERCEACLGHRFHDRSLLVRALTHGSAKSDEAPSNERLEFLGDAILGMIVSTLIFADHPDSNEGRLTKIKAQAVSKASLHAVADRLGLVEFVIVGNMFADRDSISESIIADSVEAIIAAIYLDDGFDAAIDFVVANFRPSIRNSAEAPGEADYKSRFGQWVQQNHALNPVYDVTETTGPDHDLTFTVVVKVDERVLAEASGSSKKAAEQEAARLALEEIDRGNVECP